MTTHLYSSGFAPGDRVIFGDDIPARINAVRFFAHRLRVPAYDISWVDGACLYHATVDEEEVRPCA
jgi:hypothetical protein